MMKRNARSLFVGALAAASLVAVSAGLGAAGAPVAAAATKPVKVKIVLLAETQGESTAAVPYYADGASLAADELGSKVEYSRIPRRWSLRRPRPCSCRRSTSIPTPSSGCRPRRR